MNAVFLISNSSNWLPFLWVLMGVGVIVYIIDAGVKYMKKRKRARLLRYEQEFLEKLPDSSIKHFSAN